MLKRQTDYDEETIVKKLKEYDNNVEIILEYNNFSEKEKEKEYL